MPEVSPELAAEEDAEAENFVFFFFLSFRVFGALGGFRIKKEGLTGHRVPCAERERERERGREREGVGFKVLGFVFGGLGL